jgi:C_GCAxxG_C_C family probable redox protein
MFESEVEQAVSLYQQGYSCSQSILASFAGRYGLAQDLAFKIGAPFGAGLSCTGDKCGAVSGAIMVLGLQYGSTMSNDAESRSITYQHVNELIGRFKDIHGSIQCTDLLGYNLGDPQQLQAARDQGVFVKLCPLIVRDAALILAEMQTCQVSKT